MGVPESLWVDASLDYESEGRRFESYRARFYLSWGRFMMEHAEKLAERHGCNGTWVNKGKMKGQGC
jgi:hypothetical protein